MKVEIHLPRCALHSHSSRVWLSATLYTIACHAPQSMGFSRQESWSGLPCSPPGESSWPRDQTHISCVSCVTTDSLQLSHWGSPHLPWGREKQKTTKKEIANIYRVLQSTNLPTAYESRYYLLFSSTFYTQENHSTERLVICLCMSHSR